MEMVAESPYKGIVNLEACKHKSIFELANSGATGQEKAVFLGVMRNMPAHLQKLLNAAVVNVRGLDDNAAKVRYAVEHNKASGLLRNHLVTPLSVHLGERPEQEDEYSEGGVLVAVWCARQPANLVGLIGGAVEGVANILVRTVACPLGLFCVPTEVMHTVPPMVSATTTEVTLGIEHGLLECCYGGR